MRIAFLGKGGAGKTTTSAGFVQFVAKRHPFVLAIDADVNAHMKDSLNFEGEVRQLGLHFDEVTQYLRGQRTDLGDRPMIGTTPPSSKSNFIRVSPEDPFVKKYGLSQDNITLLTVGTYQEEDVGGSCYHEKLKGLASIFHHTLDAENDVVIADTTAGTDNVATSLSFAYDMNVFVVEPTEKSLNVYLDFVGVAPHLKDRTYVVGNKVDSDEDAQFISSAVQEGHFLGFVPFSRNLKRFEQGEAEALAEFQKEQEKVFTRVFDTLKSKKRNWEQYLSKLRATFERDCQRWYSDFHGVKLDEGIDNEFRYEQVLEQKPQLSKV